MDIETERIDLGTFQKMWNGEIDAVHDQMVDALENKYVWKFVLDETYNGSAKVFEFFIECEMPSRYALIQLMNNVPDEYIENYAKEMLKKRENVDGFVERAIDIKLSAALKEAVKLNEKEISLDEFNKMMSE